LKDYNSRQNFIKEMYPHYNYFVKVATRLTKDEDDAKDLVQETYIRAYRFFDTYKIDTNAKGWLYRILKNLFINYRMKKQKGPYPLSCYENLDSHSWYSIAENETLMSDEFVVAINSIKDEYRMVIILFHLEDYSIKDIAKFLKWPEGTVKSRLHRARGILKQMITI
jgi:RNA polymerase sigma-70 factor (ECF subfamily)